MTRHAASPEVPGKSAESPEQLANPQTLSAWGKGAGIVGLPLAEAIPELRGQPFLGWLDDVFRTGATREGREQLAHLPTGPGGALEELYFNLVYAPLRDVEGAVEGVLMSAFVVTEQVRVRQALEAALSRAERSEAELRDAAERTSQLSSDLQFTTERLRAAQGAARIGIFDWDRDSQRLHWSPEMFLLMGLEPGSIEPSPDAWEAALHEEDRERGWRALAEATLTHARTFEVELRLRQPSGASRWIRLTTEVKYTDGQPNRLLGAAVDIEALKEAAAVRERALHEAERVGRAKDEFLATMSHELRTPLNAVLGWANLLRSESVDEQQRAHGLAVIERNAQAQARLVDDLLDVSRIISGKLRLSIQSVDVRAMALAALDVVKQAAESKGITLISEIGADVGALPADPDRLQQIVWNLLSNAVKFTPAGGTVTLRAERSASELVLTVADTGVGISPDKLRVIFERFEQVDGSTTRSQGGLGLGLAIVRHLAEALGGSVRAESEGREQGAEFVVTLPVRPLAAPRASSHSALRLDLTQPTAAVAVGSHTLTEARILIVDDDEDSLELLCLLLQRVGASVTLARNAIEALELCLAQPFDLIVSDISMPAQDGYELIRTLRARGITIPAVALTAYARQEDVQRARSAGFQRHSTKPVDGDSLIAVLTELRSLGR